jgi:hypothetical protein
MAWGMDRQTEISKPRQIEALAGA